MMPDFLRVHKTSILCGDRKVFLRGVNLGGWLMKEGYILHAPNTAAQIFKKSFSQALGEKALKDFEKSFRANFIRAGDFKRIAQLGFNCVRIPFNSRLIEKRPFEYDEAGVAYLDQAIKWAKQNRLWSILDLHAACGGAQNHDWHSDSLGEADLWTKKEYQERTIALWEFLAERYKNEKALAGYDLLNEAVLNDPKPLNQFYQRTIDAIRRKDKKHVLFIEGNRWAIDLDCLDRFDDANVVLSIHFYNPWEFSFNLIPHLSYRDVCNKSILAGLLDAYVKISRERQCPIFVGEFGINSRKGHFGEDDLLKDVLECFQERQFHWTYWTYKAIKGPTFPDGVYSYFPNPAWVNRQGPLRGWETFSKVWPRERAAMIRSWRTEEFTENKEISGILKEFGKENE